jgi:hypothetical protein
MKELINMKNMAVCALQQGSPKTAHDQLLTALEILKDCFAKRGQQHAAVAHHESTVPTPITPPPTPTTTEIPSLHRQPSQRRVTNLRGDEYDNERSLGEEMEEDEEPVVPSVFSVTSGVISSHNNGLVPNFNKALMILHSFNDLDALTSVVLYNIAIVNHGRAIERGSSTILTEALNFYKMATLVIKSTQEIDASCDFVLLVSSHNMAHIYSSRFCPEEMRECLETTRSLLAQESTHHFLDEDDTKLFSMSALLKVEHMRLAPAA